MAPRTPVLTADGIGKSFGDVAISLGSSRINAQGVIAANMDVDVALASLHTGLGRWRRFRAFVSLRSFRRGPSWVSRLPLPFRKAKS